MGSCKQTGLLVEVLHSKDNNNFQMQPTQPQYPEPFWKQTFCPFEYFTPNPYLQLYCVIRLKGCRRLLQIPNYSRLDSLPWFEKTHLCCSPGRFAKHPWNELLRAHTQRKKRNPAYPLELFCESYSTWGDFLIRSETRRDVGYTYTAASQMQTKMHCYFFTSCKQVGKCSFWVLTVTEDADCIDFTSMDVKTCQTCNSEIETISSGSKGFCSSILEHKHSGLVSRGTYIQSTEIEIPVKS